MQSTVTFRLKPFTCTIIIKTKPFINLSSVVWKVTSGPNSGSDDFTHTSGVVVFDANQDMANLSLLVKPDNVSRS